LDSQRAEGGDLGPCARDARVRREAASRARRLRDCFDVSAAVEELFTPDCRACREKADPTRSLDAAVSSPTANLAQSHSASRFGLDPMRPSDETERAHSNPASEVLDCEERDSLVFSDLRRKSVGCAWR